MKTNIETMSAIAGGAGALLKGMKSKQKTKALIINICIGGFLGFGVVQSLIYFFNTTEFAIGLIVFISWVGGWLSNDITEKIELSLDVFYEFIIGKFKKGTSESKEATKEEKKK